MENNIVPLPPVTDSLTRQGWRVLDETQPISELAETPENSLARRLLGHRNLGAWQVSRFEVAPGARVTVIPKRGVVPETLSGIPEIIVPTFDVATFPNVAVAESDFIADAPYAATQIGSGTYAEAYAAKREVAKFQALESIARQESIECLKVLSAAVLAENTIDAPSLSGSVIDDLIGRVRASAEAAGVPVAEEQIAVVLGRDAFLSLLEWDDDPADVGNGVPAEFVSRTEDPAAVMDEGGIAVGTYQDKYEVYGSGMMVRQWAFALPTGEAVGLFPTRGPIREIALKQEANYRVGAVFYVEMGVAVMDGRLVARANFPTPQLIVPVDLPADQPLSRPTRAE